MFDSNVVTDFVREWGYIAVFIGSLFEGEVILITASALAALGYLDLTKVFFVSLCTTVFADQFLFFLGYKLGTDWLIKRLPKLEPARAKVFKLLHTMDIFFIFAFRFVYGIRTISPLIIGSAKIMAPTVIGIIKRILAKFTFKLIHYMIIFGFVLKLIIKFFVCNTFYC